MKAEVGVSVPEEFEAAFQFDREAGVQEALRIIGQNARPPAEFLRERARALARAWEAKFLSDTQVATRARIEETRLELEEKNAEERKFAMAGLPSPAGLQERIVLLEGSLVRYEREFSEGRAKLEKLVYASRDHAAAARKALAQALVRRAASLGNDVLAAVKDLDPDTLCRFPARTPPAAVESLKKAQRLDEIAGHLDPDANLLASFFAAIPEGLGDVISQAGGFTPFHRPGAGAQEVLRKRVEAAR